MATIQWNGPTGAEERPLAAQTRIGRAAGCDVVLADNTVSSRHALIIHDKGTWFLTDERSGNGCFVNGARQQHCKLKHGDVIQLGKISLSFCLHPDKKRALARAPEKTPPVPASVYILPAILRDAPGMTAISSASSTYVPAVNLSATESPEALAQKLRVSCEISKATATMLDLPRMLDDVLAALFGIFASAERAFILLVDPKTQQISAAATRRRGGGEAKQIEVSRTALGQAMQKREAILCRDAMADAQFAGIGSVAGLSLRSMMIAPLVFHDDAFGAIHIDTRSAVGQFTQSDLELLTIAASHVAACIANVRLHEVIVANERLAAVGQTVAGLTHCIKNILQGVHGGAFILEKGLKDGNMDGTRAGWEMVKRNNGFMENLVFDLLSYSKKREPEYASANMNTLCRDVFELALAHGQARRVSVVFRPDPELKPVDLDATGIRRCVLNLAMNAVDACAQTQGEVAIETSGPGTDGLVRITIRDTGCGMSEETKSKLFTVFFSTKGSKGTGLGLPVSKKIVEEHGGRIEVESQEGGGTTFVVCLPPARIRAGTERNPS